MRLLISLPALAVADLLSDCAQSPFLAVVSGSGNVTLHEVAGLDHEVRGFTNLRDGEPRTRSEKDVLVDVLVKADGSVAVASSRIETR